MPSSLELIASRYRVVITNDPTHSVCSSNNVHAYDHEYALDGSRDEYVTTSRHAVRVSNDDGLMATCILLACGGASGVHGHSAIIHDGSCIIAVGPYMASLRIPTLELQWATQTDTATCFGVYHSEKHQCLISHRELEIARVNFEGKLVWQSGGADIFTNGFVLHDDYVHVVDFNNLEYLIAIDTGREYAAGVRQG